MYVKIKKHFIEKKNSLNIIWKNKVTVIALSFPGGTL